MNLQERIDYLRQEHQRLHKLVEKMPTSELKKKKLAVKDELTDLIDADTYQGGVENFAVYHKA